MQNAIRFTVGLVMAGMSMPVFAGTEGDPASEQRDPSTMTSEVKADADEAIAGDEATGGGSGEPGRADARADKGSLTGTDSLARAALDQQEFQYQVWTAP
jgi:hypothetical protein